MTPEQVALVQDAAVLVAAHARSDEGALGALLHAYSSPDRLSRLVEALVLYIVLGAQLQADRTKTSWYTVLDGLPLTRVDLVPVLEPDWEGVRQLAIDFVEARSAPRSVELTSTLEAALSLAVNVTHVLGGDDDVPGWAERVAAASASRGS